MKGENLKREQYWTQIAERINNLLSTGHMSKRLFLLLPEDYSISVIIKYGMVWKQDFLLLQAEKPLGHNQTCL